MRWIFYVLVLGNVVVAGLFTFHSDRTLDLEAVPASVVPQEGVADVTLLSELVRNVSAEKVGARVPMSQPVKPASHVEPSELATAVIGESQSRVCSLIGPFKALLRAEYFVEHLGALSLASEVKALEVSGGESYRVYEAPLPSQKLALRRLHEVQAKKIDSYLIPKGELRHGISFGMFGDRMNAERRMDALKKQGITVQIKAVPRFYEEIWVVLATQEAEKLSEEAWLGLLNREENIKLQQNFCPGVASL